MPQDDLPTTVKNYIYSWNLPEFIPQILQTYILHKNQTLNKERLNCLFTITCNMKNAEWAKIKQSRKNVVLLLNMKKEEV